MPTSRTDRGFHVYFRAADLRTVDLGDGELRGAGGYVVLPPSVHPSGTRYTWLVPLNGEVPTFDPRAAGLHRAAGTSGDKAGTKRGQRGQNSECSGLCGV